MNLEPLYELIKEFEGCRLLPYYCPAGKLTCGWGSTGRGVYPGRAWTQTQADQRMHQDAAICARQAQALCPDLEGDALCAIADFVYNLGPGRLRSSTLRNKINEGDWNAAIQELRKWVHGGGKKLPGLVRRREAEITLILSSGINE